MIVVKDYRNDTDTKLIMDMAKWVVANLGFDSCSFISYYDEVLAYDVYQLHFKNPYDETAFKLRFGV